MEKKAIIQYKKRFDDIRHEENGIEFWYARELMTLVAHTRDFSHELAAFS